jgi:hypothetical protein
MNSPEGRIPLVHTRRPRHLRAFLTHFGMVKADRTKNALYMRGTDPAHHIHVTENGAPGFTGPRLLGRSLGPSA